MIIVSSTLFQNCLATTNPTVPVVNQGNTQTISNHTPSTPVKLTLHPTCNVANLNLSPRSAAKEPTLHSPLEKPSSNVSEIADKASVEAEHDDTPVKNLETLLTPQPDVVKPPPSQPTDEKPGTSDNAMAPRTSLGDLTSKLGAGSLTRSLLNRTAGNSVRGGIRRTIGLRNRFKPNLNADRRVQAAGMLVIVYLIQ